MKKKFLLGLILVCAILLVGCQKKEKDKDAEDGKKFATEYTKMTEDNAFVYRDIDEIIKILEHGTAVVYLGFPECPWCQAYVPMLNDVAETEGLEKIYYFNILNDRKDNTEKYQKIVSILADNLQYDSEGNHRIYVPAIIAVSDGKIVDFNDETSLDTGGFEKPDDYWTEDKITNLKLELTDLVNTVLDNKCTDCNEK